MIIRLIALMMLVWMLGFAAFMFSVGRPVDERKTDAVVVLTGGSGRIDRGLEALRSGDAKRMLVSGVDPDVKPGEFAAQYHVSKKMLADSIDLGWQAVDTRSNADETATWVKAHGYKSVRLVTSDWHMPRAKLELSKTLPDVEVIGDGVPSNPRFSMLLREYHKYLVRRIALLVGTG